MRHGDGFFGAGSSTTSTFADQVAVVRRELTEPGPRSRPAFAIAKRVYLAVDDDPGRARAQVHEGLHRLYGDMPGIEDVAVAGTAEQVRDRSCAPSTRPEPQLLVLNPLGGDVATDREQLERLPRRTSWPGGEPEAQPCCRASESRVRVARAASVRSSVVSR